jgi:very-short-patch-repair endonuclease
MTKKTTTEEFIKKAKERHGDKYDYSQSNYLGDKDPIIIKCPDHGYFSIAAGSHIQKRGSGCQECGIDAVAFQKRVSREDFIERAREQHGNRYDYSKVDYVNFSTPVVIVCPDHEEFSQRPDNHTKHGCNQCGQNQAASKKRKTMDQFVKRAQEVHGEKYDYSKVVYVSGRKNIIIICNKHKEFFQTPLNHLKGHGCNDCGTELTAEKKQLSTEEFISKAREVHGDTYDYSEVDYVGSHIDVKIKCKKGHGIFHQQPANHITNRAGCGKCRNKREGRIAKILERKGIKHKSLTIKGKRFDFFLSDYNLIIERDGEQHYMFIEHFSDQDRNYIAKQQKNDFNKSKIVKEEGFEIARIPFWLDEKEEEKEIENILSGKPTYPDVPDIKQAITKPKPQ